MSDTKPNPPTVTMNSRDLEAATPESINELFASAFGDSTLPEWAHAYSEGTLCPSAQLCTRDGRVTGNGVLMWWAISNEMPAAVVATDAGNVILVTAEEIAEMFYPTEYLMRKPLYAHIAGVAASGIDIPDAYTFLFEAAGVDFGEDDYKLIDDGDVFDGVDETMAGPNPFMVGLMEAIMQNLAGPDEEPLLIQDAAYQTAEVEPNVGVDVGGEETFGITMIVTDGQEMTWTFDSVDERNAFIAQIGLPFQG